MYVPVSYHQISESGELEVGLPIIDQTATDVGSSTEPSAY